MYGSNCKELCECSNGAICDAKIGKCMCLQGWLGSTCKKGLYFVYWYLMMFELSDYLFVGGPLQTMPVAVIMLFSPCSRFLGNIKEAFEKNPNLTNLLLDDFFKKAILDCQASWRKVVAAAVTLGVPTPCFSTALAFFDGYR